MAEPLLVHTGQHYDAEMSDVFLRELELPEPDVFLGVGSGTHGEQTARALDRNRAGAPRAAARAVVVAGDVNSTLAGALAAAKLGIPVAHIEAGLRSFDRTMPEEHNRKLTDHLSDLLLAHSQSAVDNLAARRNRRDSVELVGNTMIDTRARRTSRRQSARRAVERVRGRGRRVRSRDAAPAGARRRSAAARATLSTALIGLAEIRSARLPRPPAHAGAARRAGRRRLGRAPSVADAPARLPRLPRPRGVGAASCSPTRAVCKRRRPRSVFLLHAPRPHRAAGHRRARDEHRARRSTPSGSRRSPRSSRRAAPAARSRSGTGTRANVPPPSAASSAQPVTALA